MALKTLTIDIGNTCTAFVIFENDKIISEKQVLTIDVDETIESFVNKDLEQVIISSVVPEINTKFSKLNPKFVSYKDFEDLTVNTDDPTKVGTDLLCKVKAMGGKPAIIISFGTATTIVVASSILEGVVIMPGIKMQMQALSSGASQIHYTKAADAKNLIGTNTTDSILAGVVLAQAFSINSFVAKLKKEYLIDEVVITGGYTKYILKHLKFVFTHQSNTVLNGLYKVAKGSLNE